MGCTNLILPKATKPQSHPHPNLPPPDGGRNKVADTARGRLKPQTQFQATSSYEQATPKTSPPFFPVVLKKNKIAATTKGRLKQKSHFQTTSLHHSAKSLTLKRHNPKRAVYRKPFASSHFSKSSTLILPPFSSQSSLLTCLPLLYFAKKGPPSSYCICFGIRPVGGRLKRFDEYEGRLKT